MTSRLSLVHLCYFFLSNEFYLHMLLNYSPREQPIPRQPRDEAIDSANAASPINQAASKEAEVVSGAERTNNPALPDCAATKQYRWKSAEERCVLTRPSHCYMYHGSEAYLFICSRRLSLQHMRCIGITILLLCAQPHIKFSLTHLPVPPPPTLLSTSPSSTQKCMDVLNHRTNSRA